MKNSAREIISVLVLALLFNGCKKNQTTPQVLDIKAGDSTSANVHFVKIKDTVNNYPAVPFYLNIGADSILVLSYVFNHCCPDIYGSSFSITTKSKNVYICTDNHGYPLLLYQGDPINDSLNWTNNGNGILWLQNYDGRSNGYNYYLGNWVNTHTGFLAFKIVSKSIIYKGWIRIGLDYIDNYACVAY